MEQQNPTVGVPQIAETRQLVGQRLESGGCHGHSLAAASLQLGEPPVWKVSRACLRAGHAEMADMPIRWRMESTAPQRLSSQTQRGPMQVQGRGVYFIGIGGCGVSGLARMLRSRGAVISGSDKDDSTTVREFLGEGVAVSLDQRAGILPDLCDLVVASAAIPADHPEVLEAQRRGIEVFTYAEALGACMAVSTGIAVAGTHGKSTTTAMLGSLLADSGLDPHVIVGAGCRQLVQGSLGEPTAPAGFRLGSQRVPRGRFAGENGLLIAEACEFNRSFHQLRPKIASISAVEADHLDIYGSLDAVVQAFAEFARLVPPASEGGMLLIAEQGAHRREITAGLECDVQTIGFSPEADWVVSIDQETHRVELRHEGRSTSWTMRLPGVHNAMNAATAAALAWHAGADLDTIGRSLSAFEGVVRRTQYLGERVVYLGRTNGRTDAASHGVVRVWDDYGHHPTEVQATLSALRAFDRPEQHGGKLICVFQPHQHSRTRFLLEEFASAFEEADVVIVPHIYFVRDSQAEKQKISSADLVDRLRGRGVRAMHLYPFEAIVEQLENVCRPGDTLVVMGAGPVWQIAHAYMSTDSAIPGGDIIPDSPA